MLWQNAKLNNPRKHSWSAAQYWILWLCILTGIVLLVMPIALLPFGYIAFAGYGWLLGIPAAALTYKKNVSANETTATAYSIYSQLKQGWAEHGEVFYRQIWNHGYKFGRYHACEYCDKRLVELRDLLRSQQEVERRAIEPIDNEIFEASAQFRAAVARQFEPDPIMKEISDKATGELEFGGVFRKKLKK